MKMIIMLLLLLNSLGATVIYVISNKKVTATEKEIKNFFSAKSDYISGSKFKRISNQEALESLAELAFSISKKKLSKKWIKQNFRKGTPFPITLKNDAQTIEWIQSHDNTIGFVSKKPTNIKIIYTFDE